MNEAVILLKAEKITKSFPGTLALNNVDLELRTGEIHAIVGENGAGKSTLMNLFSGVFKPDDGKIFFQGNEVKFNFPHDALMLGIGHVYQEKVLCPDISVAENVFMGQNIANNLGLINYKELNKKTTEILGRFENDIEPQQKVGRLSTSNQQIVEIARALALECKVLILDEPTSSLSDRETESLFNIIRELKANGISVLYISHRMSEIFTICDRVTVLKDGECIGTYNVSDVGRQSIIHKMVGRELSDMYPEKIGSKNSLLFSVKNLCRKGKLRDINLDVHKGEIVGIAGLVGAGRTELARAVCGLDKKDSGTVYLGGKELKIQDYIESIKQGIIYLTEDRAKEGLFLNLNVQSNISSTRLDRILKFGLINDMKEKELASDSIRKMNIVTSSTKKKTTQLSGGNQQKIVLAKWLLTNPKIIFMDEPTRGIDVGAKAEIHKLLRELSNAGIGIILISSELPEIIGMCDRVYVMYNGAIAGIVEDELTEHTIITYATGHASEFKDNPEVIEEANHYAG